jgi:hypothetical protein
VLLGEIERVSQDPAAADDAAGALARLAARYAAARDAHLTTVRERRRAVPRPKALRRTLKRAA